MKSRQGGGKFGLDTSRKPGSLLSQRWKGIFHLFRNGLSLASLNSFPSSLSSLLLDSIYVSSSLERKIDNLFEGM